MIEGVLFLILIVMCVREILTHILVLEEVCVQIVLKLVLENHLWFKSDGLARSKVNLGLFDIVKIIMRMEVCLIV